MERIGDYEVLGQLGRGAMGTVLRVRHARLGVERALKLLDGASQERLVRFEREARVLARVRHDNVVAVHEAGQHAGRPWFVMDLVDGEPLDEVLRRGRRSLDEALRLVAGLASGLASLHAHGVVHRDLKPANVVLRPDGSAVLLDLGVAMSAEEESDRLTRTGALVGTPMYMAPEQLVGERATPASDVYALGALLFEVVTGRPLSGGSGSLDALIARTLGGHADTRAALDDLPVGLERLLARLLAPAPADRPTAADLAEALQRADLRVGPTSRARRRARRLLAACAGGLLLAGLGGAAWALRARAPASPPAATARGEPARSRAVTPSFAAPAEAAADRALERAMHVTEPSPRARALAAWLREHLGHPRRREALAAWREARRRGPLAAWQLAPGGEVHVSFVGERHVLAWVAGRPGVRLAEVFTGAAVWEFPALGLLHVARDPRGGVVMVCADLQLRRLPPGGQFLLADTRCPRAEPVRGFAVSADRYVVVQDDLVFVLDRASGDVVAQVGPLVDDPREVLLVDEDRILVVGSGASFTNPGAPPTLRAFEVSTGRRLFERASSERPSLLLPAARGVVVGTTVGLLELLDPRTGAPAVRFHGDELRNHRGAGLLLGGLAHDVGIRGGLVLGGGARLVTIGGSLELGLGDLRCWDVTTGREVATVLHADASCSSVDASPDERLLVVGVETGEVQVWAARHVEPELDLEPGR